MENTPTPNADFENYLRKNLQQVDATPDDDVWAEIAAKQAQPNKWLKFRRYGWYAAGVVLFMVAAVGIWRQQHSRQIGHQNTLEQPMTPADTAVSMVNVPLSNDPSAATAGAAPHKQLRVPNFSPRINSVPASTVRFNAENGLQYQNPVTGTRVNIPANSLVDANGQPVNGEAELFFREYRSIGDFLASGIPMHYGDGRGSFFFNSGGMFEVRVSQAGTPLQMGAGQGYDVTFSPTTELEDASLYYLDDQTGTWRFKPTSAFGQADLNQPPVVSQAQAINGNLRLGGEACFPTAGEIVGDPDFAEMVKIGVQTGFELASGKLVMPTWFKRNPTLTDDQLLFRMERGLVQIKKHRDQSQLFFPEDLNKFFTELAAFKNCYFTYNVDSLGGGSQLKALTMGDYWQRITVKQEAGANCIITLYDGKDGQMQFHAVLSGSTENKKFKPEEVMAEYVRLREERQAEFARKNQALRYFLWAAPAFKAKAEWCYSNVEWLEFFEQKHPMMARRYADLIQQGLTTDKALALSTWKKWQSELRNQKFARLEGAVPVMQSKNNLMYSLRLSDFGVYNCDQIFRLGGEQGVQYVTAGYKTSSGTPIIPACVSILERRTRVFFTLPSAAKLLYSPDRPLDVIVTDRNGRQYHFPAEKYMDQKFDKSGVTVLTLNDVTDQTQSPKAWADLLEI